MKKIFCLFLMIFSCYNTFILAQNLRKDPVPEIKAIDTKILEYKSIASSNPAEAVKKLSDIKKYCEKIQYKKGAMESSVGLVLIYYNEGNYKKTIEETQYVEKYAQELQSFIYLSDVHRMRSNVYGETGLLNESLNELTKALPYADKIESQNLRFYRKALIYESFAGIYDKNGDIKKQIFYRHKSISESEKMPKKDSRTINAKFTNIALQYASLGLVYDKLKIKDSANYYFEEALKIHENKKYDIYNDKATLLSDMAKFHNTNKNYLRAISLAKRAEIFEKQVSMPYIRRDIYYSLFNSYLETNKKDSSIYYLTRYSSLNDSLQAAERKTIMTPVNQIISDKDSENKSSIRYILVITAGTFTILILAGWIYWRRKNNNIHKKYEEVIEKINSRQRQENSSTEIQENTDIRLTAKIPDETTKILLYKLKKFEASEKYLRKEITLTWIANNLNTNPRYLSEIIKTHRDKNFTNYINELRINYIIKKLYENPVYREYKISYLAEECGYKTQRVFLTAFKNHTGFTPSYFVKQLKIQTVKDKF